MYLSPSDKRLDPQAITKKASPETGGGHSPRFPQKTKKRKKWEWDGVFGADWQLANGGEYDPSIHNLDTLTAAKNKKA